MKLLHLFGVVNLTEDSFSDGGLYLDSDAALEHALRLYDQGADAIDLGAASSHPDSARVSTSEEIQRLEPVVAALIARGIPVSIDSFELDTQRWALAQGVAYLNDIRGFPDPDALPELAQVSTRLVVMHSVQRRGPATRARTDAESVWGGVEPFLAGRLARLEAAGVSRERMIVDPGMGFFLGVDPEPSLLALQRVAALRDRLGVPVLVSVSRKSFLGALTGRAVAERGAASLAAELFAAAQGVDYIRTHDVAALRDALAVWNALCRH